MNSGDAGQQQTPAADDVAEPPDADDQRGDGQQIGQHDPLDLLERGAERLRQASAGPTLAMLVPSEGSSIDSDKAGERPPAEASAALRGACGGLAS